MAQIPDGYGFASGPRSKERASAIIAAVREAGLDASDPGVIRVDVANNGYIVPTAALDVLDASSAKAKRESAPETSSTRGVDGDGQPVSVAPTDLPPSGETAALAVASDKEIGTVNSEDAAAAEKQTTSRKSTAK